MTSTENPTAAPLFTVTWDTVIGARNVGYDQETGYPEGEPIQLGDMVVAGIVERLVPEIKKDAEGWQGAVAQAREIANEVIRAESEKIVREALTSEIRRTNNWGEAQGEPTSLRDLIREDVQKYLTEPVRRDSFDNRKGGFRELLREEIDRALASDLRGVIQKARAEMVETVKAKAVELFAGLAKDGR